MERKELSHAVIMGAGHGIGFGLVQELTRCHPNLSLYATYHNPDKADPLLQFAKQNPTITLARVDPKCEASVHGFKELISQQTKKLDLLIHCVGFLHSPHHAPEKSLLDIDLDQLLYSFKVNSLPTVLAAKVFHPLFRHKRRSYFIALSAKVGSIGDNRLGGWYGYRASKAALNMFIKNISLEYQRRGTNTLVLALHPGTTKTDLSKPFTKHTPLTLHSIEETAHHIRQVLEMLDDHHQGEFLSWDGTKLPW